MISYHFTNYKICFPKSTSIKHILQNTHRIKICQMTSACKFTRFTEYFKYSMLVKKKYLYKVIGFGIFQNENTIISSKNHKKVKSNITWEKCQPILS